MSSPEINHRPYVGQSWLNGIISGDMALTGLEMLVGDLLEDADRNGIEVVNVELWTNNEQNAKGFFVGDTTDLPDKGWRKIAIL